MAEFLGHDFNEKVGVLATLTSGRLINRSEDSADEGASSITIAYAVANAVFFYQFVARLCDLLIPVCYEKC